MADRAIGSLAGRVAAEIRSEMARQQKSQQGLAEVIGQTVQSANRKYNGKQSFTWDDVEAIAPWLGVPVTRFFREDAVA